MSLPQTSSNASHGNGSIVDNGDDKDGAGSNDSVGSHSEPSRVVDNTGNFAEVAEDVSNSSGESEDNGLGGKEEGEAEDDGDTSEWLDCPSLTRSMYILVRGLPMMSRYEELRSFLLTRMTSQDTNLRVLLFPPQHEEGWICVRGDLQFWAVVHILQCDTFRGRHFRRVDTGRESYGRAKAVFVWERPARTPHCSQTAKTPRYQLVVGEQGQASQDTHLAPAPTPAPALAVPVDSPEQPQYVPPSPTDLPTDWPNPEREEENAELAEEWAAITQAMAFVNEMISLTESTVYLHKRMQARDEGSVSIMGPMMEFIEGMAEHMVLIVGRLNTAMDRFHLRLREHHRAMGEYESDTEDQDQGREDDLRGDAPASHPLAIFPSIASSTNLTPVNTSDSSALAARPAAPAAAPPPYPSQHMNITRFPPLEVPAVPGHVATPPDFGEPEALRRPPPPPHNISEVSPAEAYAALMAALPTLSQQAPLWDGQGDAPIPPNVPGVFVPGRKIPGVPREQHSWIWFIAINPKGPRAMFIPRTRADTNGIKLESWHNEQQPFPGYHYGISGDEEDEDDEDEDGDVHSDCDGDCCDFTGYADDGTPLDQCVEDVEQEHCQALSADVPAPPLPPSLEGGSGSDEESDWEKVDDIPESSSLNLALRMTEDGLPSGK